MFNNTLLVGLVEYAISDSGATGNFLIKGAQVVHIKVNETLTII